MDDITTLLLIAVISVGIGIAFGSLISNAINARQKTGRSKGGAADEQDEIARVYRDLKTGTVVLEMKGRKYRQAEELDAGALAFLQRQLKTLMPWIKPSEAPKAAGTGASELQEQDRPAAATPEKEAGSVSSPEPAAGSATSDESPKQSYNPLDVFARALRTDMQKTSAPPSSIAAQIDEILQEKLEGLPDEKRAIRLMELPGKGMVVMVGLDHYDGVDAVPDPEVRALIRECVREWEQKMDRQD